MYSFSGKPTAGSPMGSLNFSRVDNAQLQFTMNDVTKKHNKNYLSTANQTQLDDENHNLVAYGVNYNNLIIKGGMAGLAYKT